MKYCPDSVGAQCGDRLRRSTLDFQHLVSGNLATFQVHRRLWQIQAIGNKANQGFIRLAIDWRRSQPYFQSLAVQAGKFGFFGTGLNMQGQRDTPVAGNAEPITHKTINNACKSRIATNGERSMPEIGGKMLRIGLRIGRVS